jgi:hypothetical protein
MRHASGYAGFRGLKQNVIVVGNQTIGRNLDIPSLGGFLEQIDKYLAIG